jgi:hypothetical protein
MILKRAESVVRKTHRGKMHERRELVGWCRFYRN